MELESGDDHWERSLAAAKKAREQAMIVERESQATHAKLLAAQEATRNFEKARREHMAIQVRSAIASASCVMQLLMCISKLTAFRADMITKALTEAAEVCRVLLSIHILSIAQERLAALDLENKRANFERMSKEYEAHMARVSGKEGQVDAAQQAANELRAEVNQKVRRSNCSPAWWQEYVCLPMPKQSTEIRQLLWV